MRRQAADTISIAVLLTAVPAQEEQDREEAAISTPLPTVPGRRCSPPDVLVHCWAIGRLSFLVVCSKSVKHPTCLASLADGSLLWHDMGAIIQTAIRKAATDLGDLPGPVLHAER